MKKTIIVIAVVLLGAGALAYPGVSDYLSRINGSEIVQDYSKKVSELDEATKGRLRAEAESYNEMLAGYIMQEPPARGAADAALPVRYEPTLNIGGVMGYVEIPKIEVHLPIYHGTGDDVLNKGAGHLEGTALPIGGIGRHSVITGHSGLVHAKMFSDLQDLAAGDLFYIHVLGETLAYEAVDILVVEPDAADELAPFAGKDYCTLLTCTPYGVNTHRFLVRGERVEYIPEVKAAIQQIKESGVDNTVARVAIITTSVMLLFVGMAIAVSGRRMRRRAPTA